MTLATPSPPSELTPELLEPYLFHPSMWHWAPVNLIEEYSKTNGDTVGFGHTLKTGFFVLRNNEQTAELEILYLERMDVPPVASRENMAGKYAERVEAPAETPLYDPRSLLNKAAMHEVLGIPKKDLEIVINGVKHTYLPAKEIRFRRISEDLYRVVFVKNTQNPA